MRISSRSRHLILLLLAALVVSGAASRAEAQEAPAAPAVPDVALEDQPIGGFVVDVRGAFPKFKQDPNIALGIGVSALNLPTRAVGLAVGAHVYVAHAGPVTLGVGGEWTTARRNRTLPPATTGAAPGPTVQTRMSSLTPQISLNFGKRQGWSYISGGIGATAFTAERQDAPLPAQESRTRTFNYGGGARWFSKKHVALSVDLRFYAINPQEQTAVRPAFSRMTLVAFNVGASFK